jgi:hypothetical protein
VKFWNEFEAVIESSVERKRPEPPPINQMLGTDRSAEFLSKREQNRYL